MVMGQLFWDGFGVWESLVTRRLMPATPLILWITLERGTEGKWLVFSLSFSAPHWNDGITSCLPECLGLDCY